MHNNRIERDFGLAAPLRSAANPKRLIQAVGNRSKPMKDKTLNVDGTSVVIRPMDKDHVVDFCGPERTKGRSDPAFQQFHRELMERYGNSAIVALSQGKIVGFVNFAPANVVTTFPLCPEHVPANPQVDWPSEPSKTLGVGCVNVDQALSRKGVGSALVQVLIDWAHENGYTSIVADANENAWWKPCRPFWEKLGFHVKEVKRFVKPRGDGDTCVYIMEKTLQGED